MIVIFEKSTGEFHKIPDAYVHHGKTSFPTGLKLNFLQEYYLIALDVFQKFPYPKIRNEQTAWLSLLVTQNVEDAERLMKEYSKYSWLREIYEEMAMLRRRPEEVLGLFSEALRILDENTMNYMIEELQKELASAIGERDAAIEEKNAVIEEKDTMIEELKKKLENYEK